MVKYKSEYINAKFKPTVFSNMFIISGGNSMYIPNKWFPYERFKMLYLNNICIMTHTNYFGCSEKLQTELYSFYE